MSMTICCPSSAYIAVIMGPATLKLSTFRIQNNTSYCLHVQRRVEQAADHLHENHECYQRPGNIERTNIRKAIFDRFEGEG